MKQKKVWILSGPPASGKSTWVRKNIGPHDEWVSRDSIRFSMLKDNNKYFDMEDRVFETFVYTINRCLADPDIENVYVDATHITRGSRRKITHRLDHRNISELNCIVFNIPLGECLDRNSHREGRAKVPDEVIEDMYKRRTFPTRKEGFNHIYKVTNSGVMEEI